MPRADALKRLIEKRAIDGLSIGFRTVRATREPGTGNRKLWAIDLWEISIVTFPMMDSARIAARALPLPLDRSLPAAISLMKTGKRKKA